MFLGTPESRIVHACHFWILSPLLKTQETRSTLASQAIISVSSLAIKGPGCYQSLILTCMAMNKNMLEKTNFGTGLGNSPAFSSQKVTGCHAVQPLEGKLQSTITTQQVSRKPTRQERLGSQTQGAWRSAFTRRFCGRRP